MVTVKITETYDLKTTQNKLGLIGVHTPRMTLIQRLYPGLISNYKFIRFKKCDIAGASASSLPVDPLQVSYNAGSVAPEDMFNPILMKAVTNESFETLLNYIYTHQESYTGQSVDISESISGDVFKKYYALLAEHGGKFRKSLPQMGFSMRGLVPMAHMVVSPYGEMVNVDVHSYTSSDAAAVTKSLQDNLADMPVANSGLTQNTANVPLNYLYRGRTIKMPRLPIRVSMVTSGQTQGLTTLNSLVSCKTYVALLVVPPAKLSEFYYRMRVTWTVEFSELITANEYATGPNMETTGDTSYKKLYPDPAVELENTTDSVDTTDVSIEKIMES